MRGERALLGVDGHEERREIGFGRMAQALLEARTPQEALDRTVRAVVDVVPSADLVSITTIDGGELRTPAGSAEKAFELDEVQYDHGEGACVEAARSAATCASDDLARDPRWPRFGPAAADRGAQSLVSTPLPVVDSEGQQLRGALNAYSTGEIPEADREALSALAAETALGLAAARARRQAEQLREALGTRDVIGMAKGILMATRGVDDQGAFALLRDISQNNNVKLHELAATLVERHPELDLAAGA